MTSLTTIFGLVPLALGLGPGAQMQQPLAIAVIGGLITNMLLTRLLIPVGYLLLNQGTEAAEPCAAELSLWHRLAAKIVSLGRNGVHCRFAGRRMYTAPAL